MGSQGIIADLQMVWGSAHIVGLEDAPSNGPLSAIFLIQFPAQFLSAAALFSGIRSRPFSR